MASALTGTSRGRRLAVLLRRYNKRLHPSGSSISRNSGYKTPKLSSLGQQMFVSCPSSRAWWVARGSAPHSDLGAG